VSCCGKIKKGVKVTRQIAEGYTKDVVSKMTGYKHPAWAQRVKKCHGCAEQTWLDTRLPNILKELPKQDPSPQNRHLFCRICRCYMPAKTKVKDAQCPLGLW
jgi:hypothetical protein